MEDGTASINDLFVKKNRGLDIFFSVCDSK